MRRDESNVRPRGYEPRELPLLHAASFRRAGVAPAPLQRPDTWSSPREGAPACCIEAHRTRLVFQLLNYTPHGAEETYSRPGQCSVTSSPPASAGPGRSPGLSCNSAFLKRRCPRVFVSAETRLPGAALRATSARPPPASPAQGFWYGFGSWIVLHVPAPARQARLTVHTDFITFLFLCQGVKL